MKIIWLGHGSFRIEIEDQVLLIDPWLTGNPVLKVVLSRFRAAPIAHLCSLCFEGQGAFPAEC